MTETLTKIIVNCETGEVQELPLTAEEIAQREADAIEAAKERAEREAAEAEKQANKESAKAKLAALGLSDEEVAALLG